MLKNKKKLRRIERNTPGSAVKTARSLVLAGALVGAMTLGAAGVASAAAAAPTWGADVDVNVTDSQTLTGFTDQEAKTLSVTGSGALSITSGGYAEVRLTKGGPATLNVASTGSLTLDGTVVLGIDSASPWGYYGSGTIAGNTTLDNGGSVQLDTIAITGGTHIISDQLAGSGAHPDKGAWRKGSQYHAGSSLAISGSSTVVNLGDYGLLGAGTTATPGKLTIDGATVNMAGTATAKASVIRTSGSNSSLTVSNGGKINVTANNTGVIASPSVTVTGHLSSITVAANSTLEITGGTLPDTAGADATAVTDKGLTMSSGQLNIADSARVFADDVNVTKGTVNITGSTANGRSGIYNLANDGVADGDFKFGAVSGKDADVTVNVLNGGGIEGKDITINSGTYTIAGKGHALNTTESWRNGSIIFADHVLTIAGGNITVGDYGIVGAGQSSGSKIDITGGTVKLNGSTNAVALLRAASDKTGANDSALTIGNGAGQAVVGVDAGKFGVIIGDTVNVQNNGSLDVAQGGSLSLQNGTTGYGDNTITGGAAGLTVNDGVTLDITGGKVNVAGDMLIHGTLGTPTAIGSYGIVNVGAGGKLHVTGNLDGEFGRITGGAGDVAVLGTYTTRGSQGNTAKDSKIDYSGTGTFTMGALNLVPRETDGTATLNVSAGAVEFLGLDGTASVFNGEAINVTGGKLNFGSSSEAVKGGKYDGTVTVSSSGTMNVQSGNWKVKDLDVQAGVAKINGGMLTITNDLKSAAVGNGTTGINVAAGGALQADRDMVETNTDNTGGSATLKTIDVAAGGTLLLSGTGSMTLAEVQALRAQVMTGKGALDLGSVAITGVTANDTLETVKNSASIGGIVKGGTLTSGTSVVGGISTDAVVNGGADLALTGKGANGTLAAGGVTVGSDGNSSTLTLGSAAQTASGTVAGEIKTGGTANSTIQTVNGAFTVGGGIDLSTGTGADTLNVINSSLSTTTITAGTGDVISVGSASSSGTLTADSVTLGGGSLLIDPAWGQASSRVAIAQFTDAGSAADVSALGGLVGVGMNSMLSVGTKDTALLDTVVNKLGGLSEDGYSAALGLYHSVTLNSGTGGIEVDGTKTSGTLAPAVNTATFAEGSLLVVNAAAGLGTNGALHAAVGTGTLKLDNDASLLIVNGQAGQSVKITSGFGTLTPSNGNGGWTGDNLFTDTALVYGEGSFATGTGNYTVDLKSRAAVSVFPKLSSSMGALVDNVMRVRDLNSPSAGIRFVSRATSDAFIGRNNTDLAAATIEGAAQMGAVAGVQVSTIGAANAASGAVTTRTSFAQPLMDMTKAVAVHQDADGALSLDTGLNAGNGMKNGLGVWIMPLYQSNHTWGQKAENFKSGISSDLGGIALGADYTVNDMFRFGAAFNVGGGYAQSSGDFNKTDNNFNFWGVNLYGGWTMNNFGLSADVGYTSNYNKVEQDMPAAMAMSNLKSDITSSAWSAGLKGEYKFETSMVDIIPHIGVRYMGLTTDSYDVKSGGTVFAVEQDFQSIWTFPIGVAFSKTIESDSGWMFKPQVDLSVIPAAGDIKAKSKASIPGVMGDAEMKMQVVDYVTFDGGVGFEVGKDNVSFGLNYNIQASEHRTGHGVFGTLRYEF